MGGSKSRLVTFDRLRFPYFKSLQEIAPGFWNVRAPFYVLGTYNIGTHMSVCELGPDRFVAIDCVELTASALAELNELTQNGKLLVAVINTHPFHTRAVAKFHSQFPSSAGIKWMGCPRHLIKCTHDSNGQPIVWSHDLNECSSRRVFEPTLQMSIPDGAEFVDPQPPTRNHLGAVLVLHVPSKTLHVDDCLNYVENMGALPRLVLGQRALLFHPSLLFSGLHPTAAAPLQFKQWAQRVLVDGWDYERIASAHNAVLHRDARPRVAELLKRTDAALKKLSLSNARAEAERAATSAWEGKPVDAPPRAGAAAIVDDRCQDCWSDVEIECG